MQSGFIKRATYTLPATSGVETDLVFRFVITYAPEMNLDFSDIRFYDSDDLTLLKHDRFSYTSGTTATFWVKVPSKLAAGQPIYLYYGNPALTDVSDPENVYLMFDEFIGADGSPPDPTKWVLSGVSYIDIYSNKLRVPTNGTKYIYSIANWSYPVGMLTRVKDEKADVIPGRNFGFGDNSANLCAWHKAYSTGTSWNKTQTPTNLSAAASSFYSSWHTAEIRYLSNSRVKFYFDGTEEADLTGNENQIHNILIRQTTTGGVYSFLWFEYIYVFKLPSDGTEITDFTTPDIVENVLCGIQVVPTLVTFLETKFHTNISAESKFKKFFSNRSTKKVERFKLEFQGISDLNFKTIYDFYRTHYGGAKKFFWENAYIPDYVLSILGLTTEDLTVRFEEGSFAYEILSRNYNVEFILERDVNS